MEEREWERAFPKSTRKRRLLLRLLSLAPKPMSAEELYTSMRETMPLNLSTVYRSLALLTQKGLVQRVVGDDGVAYYTLSKTHSHAHLLTCSVCGRSVPVESCPIDALASKLSVSTGFSITGHRLELYGVCPGCQREFSAQRERELSAQRERELSAQGKGEDAPQKPR